MTAEEFRKLALAMPGASEGAHQGHADFRADGRIFATLGYPDATSAMVKLGPAQQVDMVAANPEAFAPAKGAWGRKGSTLVRLVAVDEAAAARASRWPGRTSRPKRLPFAASSGYARSVPPAASLFA